MNTQSSLKSTAGALISSLACAATVNAASTVSFQLFNVDFNGTGGPGTAPTPRTFDGDLTDATTAASVNWVDGTAGNDTWNGTPDNLLTGSLNGINTSAGQTSSVNVSWSGFTSGLNNYNNGRSGNPVTNGPNGDALWTPGYTDGTVTISNLVAGALYNLTVIGGSQDTRMTVNGSFQDTGFWNSSNLDNYVVFNNVTATGGTISFTSGGGGNNSLAGFQLTAADATGEVAVVPEPSTFTFLGLSALGCLFRRKRA